MYQPKKNTSAQRLAGIYWIAARHDKTVLNFISHHTEFVHKKSYKKMMEGIETI